MPKVEKNPDLHEDGFTTHPTNHALAFYESQGAANSAIEQLVAQGVVKEDVSIFKGEKGMKMMDLSGDRHGPLGNMARWLQGAGDLETVATEKADHALHEGHTILLIKTDGEDETREQIQALLKATGSYYAVYFGSLMTERLVGHGGEGVASG